MSAVHDLPVKFAPSNSVTHKKQLDTESLLPSKNSDEVPSHTHQRVQEETAATPPTYKYEKAKQISLEESLMLQKSQKEKQDVSIIFTLGIEALAVLVTSWIFVSLFQDYGAINRKILIHN